MPRVSICIPAYKPDYFDLALRSALAQSYTDVEILVSDDCPTDDIRNICEKYGDNIKYSKNPNPSQINNIIRLTELAQGEYIKFLFDDDLLHPFCVQYLLESLEETRDKNTKVAFSPRNFINERNKITNYINYFKVDRSLFVLPGRDYIRLTAINHVNLIGEYSTAMFRKEDCFDDDQTFCLYRLKDGYFPGTLDLSAWVEIAQHGNFVAHPQVLSYFRQHSNSSSNHKTSKTFIYIIKYYEVILNFANSKGYLLNGDNIVAYRNLLKEYRYWMGDFPELGEDIKRIEEYLEECSP